MNEYEVLDLYTRKSRVIRASEFAIQDGFIIFYDKTVSDYTTIVAVISAKTVRCVVNKEHIDG